MRDNSGVSFSKSELYRRKRANLSPIMEGTKEAKGEVKSEQSDAQGAHKLQVQEPPLRLISPRI